MEEMKDSDIRWIGQIPKNWKVIRVKDAFTRKKAKAKQENPVILSLARSGVKVRDITNNEGQLAENYSDYNPVMVDDLLLNPMDLISGDNCNISRVEGVISPAYVNLRYKNGINPEFYNFYFKYQYWCKAFFAYGKGVSFENRWTLNYDTLERFPLILPPIEEQNRIVKFLKGKCAEIDALHMDIEKQIETLEEYKKSIITEAVTKGLDPDVEMKDSGISYIGNIPKHWKVTNLKYLGKCQNGISKGGEYFGNGFPFEAAEGKKVFLMGGGIGVPPILELAKQMKCDKKQIVVGYRDAQTFLKEEFEQNGELYISTENGSVGTTGNVMDAIRENGLEADMIYACGPTPMLRAIKQYAEEHKIVCYISLEERMACGIGACLGCVCKTKEKDAHSNVCNKRICKDGPVFLATEVEI